jgi:subtilisin family serine protease
MLRSSIFFLAIIISGYVSANKDSVPKSKDFYNKVFSLQHKMSANIFSKLLSPEFVVIPAIVVMKNQADLSNSEVFTNKTQRNTYVVNELWQTAKAGQVDIVNFLSTQRNLNFRQFYIFNGLALYNPTQDVILEVANRADVLKVYYNPVVKNDVYDRSRELNPRENYQENSFLYRGIESGITHTKAPELWDLGIKGRGIVVGIQDTGIDASHPAIAGKYRGYSTAGVDHSVSWHDSIHFKISSSTSRCGYENTQPCDDDGHGTHVTGTITGHDQISNAQIGMAPEATWIGCRNMDAGDGSPATYIECYEFFLAPYAQGLNPLDDFSSLHPEKAADVISNSWGCPASEGCDKDEILLAVKAIKAAGIFNVVSAGNEGYGGCGTIGSQPATLSDYSLTVGAIDASDNQIAAFSSKGPSTYDQRIGPDIVAPGVSVRSSVPGGRYSSLSGTSMAGPHVAGLVALLLSYDNGLRGQIDGLSNVIRKSSTSMVTSDTCGGNPAGAIPNNTFGYGYIDALKALELLIN